MTVQIVGFNANQSNWILGVTGSAPQPGDLVVYLVESRSTTGVLPTSVTGLGATWTNVGTTAAGHVGVWIGAGATAIGDITNNVTGTLNRNALGVAAWRLRGADPYVASLQGAYANGLVATPAVPAGPGQIVLSIGRTAYDAANTTPALASWTTGMASSQTAFASRVPAATELHSLAANSTPVLISQLVLGTPAPDAVTDLAATATDTTITATWAPPPATAPVSGYTVQLDSGPVVDVGTDLSAEFTALTPSTTYTVSVRAYNVTGPSAAQTVTLDTTAPPAVILGQPTWTNKLALSLGLNPAVVQPVVEVRRWTGGGFEVDPDLSHALAGYSVTYGRSGPTGPADPIKATITLATRLGGPTPESGTRLQIALCEPVRIALGLLDGTRFTGEVTDPSVNHASRLTTLVCVGRLGRGNRLPVDGTAWPVEGDAARVSRVLEEAVGGLWVSTVDPGTATLAAPTRIEPAVKLLDLAIASTGGQVVEGTGGTVAYHDANHRRGVNPSLTLSAGEVFRSITWAQRVGDVVNDATVKTASGGTVEVIDGVSVDAYGPYPASVDTALVDEEDAYALGTLLVGRRARPAWMLPDVQVDLMRTVALDDLPAVLGLRHGNRLVLAGLPEGCPVPPKVFVEGWTETATATSWRLVVAVSDPTLSGVSLRYMDVPATDAYQYADVDPGVRYIDVARIEDPAELL